MMRLIPAPLSPFLFIILLGSLFSAALSHAEEGTSTAMSPLNLTSRTETANTQFLLGLEGAELKLLTGTLSGYGTRFGVEYALSERWSLNPNLSLVFGAPGTQTFLYTGINGIFRYSILGSARTFHHEISRGGTPMISQSSQRKNRLSVGVGVEQIFLNGSQSVYPAAGFSLIGAYSFSVFHQWYEMSVRGAKLTANNKSVQAVFFNLSFLLGI